jgi:hypothetical protein
VVLAVAAAGALGWPADGAFEAEAFDDPPDEPHAVSVRAQAAARTVAATAVRRWLIGMVSP